MEKYLNRKDAGEKLAEEILKAAKIDVKSTIVLGLARGGIVVAEKVARALKVPVDVLVVKKLGSDFDPELGVGAVGEHVVVLSTDYPLKKLAKQIRKKKQEIREKMAFYGSQIKPESYQGKTIIIVDDGLARGYTMEAAIKEIKFYQKPQKIIVAVPVAPKDTLERIQPQVDKVICPLVPYLFWAVGGFYADFSQTTDEEVKRIISQVP